MKLLIRGCLCRCSLALLRLTARGRAVTLLFMVVCWVPANLVFSETLYPFETKQQDVQFHGLLKELRCLVCQNQDLSDSNAELAQDLRMQVYHLVREGKTDGEIMGYLTERYGDFILFRPPVKAVTAVLWFGPVVFLFLGGWIVWRTCLNRRNHE